MKNFPSLMFILVCVLVGVAFFNSSCDSQAEIERARAETVRQEVNLEQAKAATTIANADAFSEKSQAVFPYAIFAVFIGAGLLAFAAWYLRGPQPAQPAQQSWQPPYQPVQQLPAPYQQPQLPAPIVINLMLPGAGDTRPAMLNYQMEFNQGRPQPYVVDVQPAQMRDVALRLID